MYRSRGEEAMLTVAEAARLLGCSRPRIAMMVEQGLFAGTTLVGGAPRIPQSSVLAYQAQTPVGSADYKAAAREAGLYGIPDQVYVERSERRQASKS